MKVAKLNIISIIVSLLSCMELVYQISFKLDITPYYSYYIYVIPLQVILLLSIYKLKTNKLKFIGIYLVFFVFEMLMSFHSGAELNYALVVLLSILNILLIYFICDNYSSNELAIVLKKSFLLIIFLLVMTDVLSILVMGKSQHVILSNVSPILIIILLSLSLMSRVNFLMGLTFVLYLMWIVISVGFFTIDQRFQAKSLVMCIIIILAYVIFYTLSMRVKFSLLRRRNNILYILLFIFILSAIALIIQYFLPDLFANRSASLGLRSAVASAMFYEFFSNGTFLNYIIGFGAGSSMIEFPVEFGIYKEVLRSHSGLLSFFYEFGIIGIIVLLYVLFNSFLSFSRKERRITISKAQFSIFIYVMTWLVLNVMYLISIPIPNYAHQSMLAISVVLIIFIKKKASEK